MSAEAIACFAEQSAFPPATSGDVAALRDHYDAFNRRHLDIALASYAVDCTRSKIAGVVVDIVVPAGGATCEGTLLCLHGGAFMWGRGAGALLKAAPVAAVTGMRVIAVEYALAPEQIFPAAVDDVLAVYQSLLGTEPARRIGIYGCSAGGILTAQAVSRMIAEKVALPGAIAMLCGTGLEMIGDSAASAAAFAAGPGDAEPASLAALPYFVGADLADPLVFPGEHPARLAEFPPSLLITGTRDFAASSVTVMHRRLLAAGAEAALIQFDGMWHAHHMATTLPESRETFAALNRFFAAHLA
ncbi:MAG: alpha/beta hydrolase [Novosphingobium sp.]